MAMTADEYRSGPHEHDWDANGDCSLCGAALKAASDEQVRSIARVLDRRFSHPVVVVPRQRDASGRFARKVDSVYGPVAAGLVARDYVQPTGIRATLDRHFAWDLDEPLPIFRAALAAVEERAS